MLKFLLCAASLPHLSLSLSSSLLLHPCPLSPSLPSSFSLHLLQSKQDQQLDCALDLMRRLPPQQIEKNLSDLIDLVRSLLPHLSPSLTSSYLVLSPSLPPSHPRTSSYLVLSLSLPLTLPYLILFCPFSLPPSTHQVPSLCEDLLSSVDQPLKIARDKTTGKDYLLCDYNRDGDSYRSGEGESRRKGEGEQVEDKERKGGKEKRAASLSIHTELSMYYRAVCTVCCVFTLQISLEQQV